MRCREQHLNIILHLYNMKIGSRIKELRLKEGYSQKDLSIKSALSKRTIQRIEKM